MMNLIKYKSVGESGGILMMKNGLSALFLKSPQKGLVPSQVESLVSSDVSVSAGFSSFAASATMGMRLFSSGMTGSLVKRDMFRAGNTPTLFSGRQSLSGLVPHQCNKSHMLPYFVRSLVSNLVSQLSGQTPPQEPKTKENKVTRSSKLQRESSCDETSSTKVSLNQFPGLMVHGMVDNSKTRRLLRLNPDTGYFEQEQDVAAADHDYSHHNELQVPHQHICRGSAYGWLFLTDDNLDMRLLNPFSGAEIQLPSLLTLPNFMGLEKEDAPRIKWSVYKAVFSANPSVEPRPVVLLFYSGAHMESLAFCKPGDKGWTHLEFLNEAPWRFVDPIDAVYHNGQFYVLSYPGFITAFDIGRCIDDDDLSVKTTLVATPAEREYIYKRDWHLVVLDGELVRFELRKACFYDCCIDQTKKKMEFERMRDGDTTDDENNILDSPLRFDVFCAGPKFPKHTYGIKIRRFDESEKQWVKVESLGDKAVFLGFNTSFALSASDYPAGLCIPNSVYFTYGAYKGYDDRYEKFVYDMGIYNVKDKSVKPLYLPTPMDDVKPRDDDDYDSDSYLFLKPAPIWIVDASDDTERK